MLQAFRFALRSIAKTPVFTAVVVLTLAVGIGGVTATDSVTYLTAAVLLFCVALATSVISALPVLRIHPADTLRAE